MNLLLDTHVFIWWTTDANKLSSPAQIACGNLNNTLFLSVASIWEMQIKLQLGKLRLPQPLSILVENQRRTNDPPLLAIAPAHIYALDMLQPHHKDPFDRLLIAQANTDHLTVVTADSSFAAYSVPFLW